MAVSAMFVFSGHARLRRPGLPPSLSRTGLRGGPM
jgi:hypothetical protein